MEEQNFSSDSMRILAAEDDMVNKEILNEMLAIFGMEVTFVENGNEVIAMMQNSIYDLILMDIEMPEMNGYQATMKIRQQESQQGKKRIPIIALTAHLVDEVQKPGEEAGMDDYLSKPIKMQALKEKLDYWHSKVKG